MNKYNTVLAQMLELISRSQFEKLVKEHQTEFGAKGLRSWTQFVTMLFSQLSGQHGLRSIEQAMNNQMNSWYHLGIPRDRDIKRSTLSYANNHRSAELFKSLFELLVEEAQTSNETHGMSFKNPLYSIDATTIDLCLKLFPWAEFREKKGGIKLLVKLDHRGKIPCHVIASNAVHHESKKIGEVPYQANDVLTFDRGFNNYQYYKKLYKDEVIFVTRLKSNAVYTVMKTHASDEQNHIKSDEEIVFPSLHEEGKPDIHFRKIIAIDPKTEKEITLLTNQLEWTSSDIGEIYKQRWQIELFFKAIKQNLKIKRFYGNSRNAVMTQIWIALIAYLLFYLLKKKSRNAELSFTLFISVMKTMLFQRVSLLDLLSGSSPPRFKIDAPLQFVFNFFS